MKINGPDLDVSQPSPSVHTLGQDTGIEWYESVLSIQLVIQFTHPPGQLFQLHLVVTRLYCVCSIIKALDQDLLGKEPVKDTWL